MGIEPTVDLSGPPLDLKSRSATRPLATPVCQKALLYKACATYCIKAPTKKQANLIASGQDRLSPYFLLLLLCF
jgi:hypothetical protein